MTIRPGETVGSYEVVRRIGAGGTAEVFEVRHTVLGTSHAMKVLLSQWVENAQVRSRFLQEGRIQSKLDHPGVVRVTDTIAEPGVAGLVMELLQGESLRDRLDREGRPAPQQAVTWVRAVLDVLRVAHAAGVTHRDLKPENLFLERRPDGERVRVLDFGIAKAPEASHLTSQRGALGTCAYMSPEQVKDPSSVDARTDVFALGAVLWELLVGRPAFDGATPYESMQRVLTHDPGAPSAARPEVPGWLDDVVVAALRKDRAHRIPTAEAFATALDAGARGSALPGHGAVPRRGGPTWVGWLVFGLVAVGVPVVLMLGAGALVVGAVWLAQPSKVELLSAVSDPCGATTITVDARGRDDTLEILADGRSLGTWTVSGPTRVQHVEALDLEGSVVLEARTSDDSQSLVHGVGGRLPGLTVQRSDATVVREGAVGRTLVRAEGTCLPDRAGWEASFGGTTVTGQVPVNREIWLDTQGLPVGSHLIEVRLVAPSDGGTLAHVTHSLDVAGPPPPGDLDADGYEGRASGGSDCDDGNPSVNPGAPEQPSPNGIDDDCDGLVDEGTVAFDDDGDGLSEQQGDCDDTDRATHPGAAEQSDCRDQDCDGEIDEGAPPLPQREDPYEPNDTRTAAHDLRTSTRRSFHESLELVASSTTDDAWFAFYSQDGDWDDWGIDVTVTRMPGNSTVRLEILDAHGGSRGSALARADGDQLLVRGKAFRDDSGDYTLQISPVTLHADWCPIRVEVTSR